MKRMIIISAIVVSVALIGLAFASGHGNGGWRRTQEEKISYLKFRITEKLQLNDAQKATLDRIAEDIMAKRQDHIGERQAFKEDLMDLIAKDTVTAEELKTLFDTKKPAIEGMMQLASEHIAEFHSILTPEQRATLIAEIESHQSRRCRFWR